MVNLRHTDSQGFYAAFLPQDLVLLLEVHDHILLVPVDPSRESR